MPVSIGSMERLIVNEVRGSNCNGIIAVSLYNLLRLIFLRGKISDISASTLSSI